MKQGSSYKKLCIGNIRIHRRLLSYCTHSTVVTSSLCEITTIISSLTMLSRTASIVARRVTPARVSFAAAAAPRSFSSEAAASSAASSVTLNLSVPYESIYKGAAVDSVIIPGTEGEYGITVNHVPYVAQMKPGVLQVLFEGSEPEKYFVAGGFAVTHENSVTVRKKLKLNRWKCQLHGTNKEQWTLTSVF